MYRLLARQFWHDILAYLDLSNTGKAIKSPNYHIECVLFDLRVRAQRKFQTHFCNVKVNLCARNMNKSKTRIQDIGNGKKFVWC